MNDNVLPIILLFAFILGFIFIMGKLNYQSNEQYISCIKVVSDKPSSEILLICKG